MECVGASLQKGSYPLLKMFSTKLELNQVEKDFIEFISKKRGRQYEEIKEIFLENKRKFKFQGQEFSRIMYDNKNEVETSQII